MLLGLADCEGRGRSFKRGLALGQLGVPGARHRRRPAGQSGIRSGEALLGDSQSAPCSPLLTAAACPSTRPYPGAWARDALPSAARRLSLPLSLLPRWRRRWCHLGHPTLVSSEKLHCDSRRRKGAHEEVHTKKCTWRI